MRHKPIQLIDLSLYWSNKICFEHFTASIHYGDRIAIIGRNGCGKSSLLKLLQGLSTPTYGKIKLPNEVQFGYLQQIIVTENNNQSGAEQLNSALTQGHCQV
ncbi:MAG: ATP-binding cassette domain-containing protein [Gammaproteobacteria bacterium]|nr:ATP-binding cassette domain-containing protein [Gammaproteobacteria bacterium]